MTTKKSYFGSQLTFDEVQKLKPGDELIFCNNRLENRTVICDAKVLGQSGPGLVLVELDDINLSGSDALTATAEVASWENLYHKASATEK